MAEQPRTGLVLVSGLAAEAAAEAAEVLANRPDTVFVHHDLRRLSEGVVTRRVRSGSRDRTTALELAHGCVSCTLREDMLPLLRELAGKPAVRRIVLRLDPGLEPEAICWAVRHVLVGGRPVIDQLDIEAVVTAIDPATWLTQATGDDNLAEHGMAVTADDDRTLAQVAVGQVEFADVIVTGRDAPEAGQTDAWTAARTSAVLDRLAPTATRTGPDTLGAHITGLPGNARRGRVDGAHDPILRGQPPLDRDAGCELVLFHDPRPFHPQRLHAAIDVLLDGVVRTRGRVWVASQPDTALWLESAGGGLRVGHAGPWLAALDESQWDAAEPQRRAMATLRWDPYYGDRAQELAILTHRADPDSITAALRAALLTDEELAGGWESWSGLPDPFGDWHADPCAGLTPTEDRDVDASTGKDDK